MYSTGIKNSFTARHRLIGDFGDESLPHEHSYVIEWICSVSELDENGFGVNIDILYEKLEEVTESLSGILLNDLAFFKGKQTSIENTAHYIMDSLFKELENESYPVFTIERSEVKIWESDTAWASYIKP